MYMYIHIPHYIDLGEWDVLFESCKLIMQSWFTQQDNVKWIRKNLWMLAVKTLCPVLLPYCTLSSPHKDQHNQWSWTPLHIHSFTTLATHSRSQQQSTKYCQEATHSRHSETWRLHLNTRNTPRDVRRKPEACSLSLTTNLLLFAHSCGSCWYEGQWSIGCDECGGSAMTQPCLLCSGHCGRTWTRSVDMVSEWSTLRSMNAV